MLFSKSKEGEILGRALRKNGIDFAFYKQKGLFAGREAQEILYLLEAVAHPADHSRRAKVWLTRFFGSKIHESWTSNFIEFRIFISASGMEVFGGCPEGLEDFLTMFYCRQN